MDLPGATNHPAAKKSNSKMMYLIGGLVVVLLIVLAGLWLMGGRQGGTGETTKVFKQSKVTEVAIKTEYANPFERDTQYANPFNEFKSPFQALQ